MHFGIFKFDFNQIWYQTYFGQAYSDMAANKSIIVPDETSTTLQKWYAFVFQLLGLMQNIIILTHFEYRLWNLFFYKKCHIFTILTKLHEFSKSD